jgi:hypothetical protein
MGSSMKAGSFLTVKVRGIIVSHSEVAAMSDDESKKEENSTPGIPDEIVGPERTLLQMFRLYVGVLMIGICTKRCPYGDSVENRNLRARWRADGNIKVSDGVV